MLQSKKSRSLFQVAALSGAIVTAATSIALSPVGSKYVRAQLRDNPKVIVDEVWQIVNHQFADISLNRDKWQATRQSLLGENYSSKEQAYTAIRSALKQLQDPYTRFLDPKEFQALRDQTIKGELSGIGIRIKQEETTKNLVVASTIENSPALKAGIKAGDRIIAIDGKSTQGMTIENASSLIRGKAGTPVTLQIQRQGQANLDIKITRANIEVQKVSYSINQEGNKRVGYIRLSEFSATAPAQMRRAIQDINSKQVDGFVLDLRGNPGGLLVASVEIARMWLDNGQIVREVERVRGSTEFKANRTALTQKPLVVLVDKSSASASEILAGALKDNKRAKLVGSQTFGKALVQQVFPLSDGSGLTVTVGSYFTPNGSNINKKGIVPDVKIDLTQDQLRYLGANPELIGTKNDPQYNSAISVLTGGSLTVGLKPGI